MNMNPPKQNKLSEHVETENTLIRLRVRSLIRVFSVYWQNHLTLQNVSMESKYPDVTLCMRGMNLNLCILRMFEKYLFRLTMSALKYSVNSSYICELLFPAYITGYKTQSS